VKVLLINPPNENMITTNLPSFIEEERGHYPPLGIMYMASYAEQNTDYKIEILDANVEDMNYNIVRKEVKKRKPDVVGITTTTFTLVDAIATAKIVKNIDKDIKVVLGGSHVSIYPNETINIPEIDYLIQGEGEISFTKLIQSLDMKLNLKRINGLVFRSKNRVINNGPGNLIKNLDKLPFPARHMTPYEKYYSPLAKRSSITTMITSRGCPFNCLFCSNQNSALRMRSTTNVVDEIEQCVNNFNIREFLIYDNTFPINKKAAIDISKEILKRKLDISFSIRARVDMMDKRVIKYLKKAGCEKIHYGVESSSPSILKILRKRITIKQIKKAFKITKEADISTLAYFIIGNPTETKKQIMKTIEFSKKLNPDFVHFSVLVPFPGTDLYKLGLRKNIFKDFWVNFAQNPKKDFVPELWEENLTKDELMEMLRYAYRSFYIRPSYLAREILKIRSFKELKRKSKVGLKVLNN